MREKPMKMTVKVLQCRIRQVRHLAKRENIPHDTLRIASCYYHKGIHYWNRSKLFQGEERVNLRNLACDEVAIACGILMLAVNNRENTSGTEFPKWPK